GRPELGRGDPRRLATIRAEHAFAVATVLRDLYRGQSRHPRRGRARNRRDYRRASAARGVSHRNAEPGTDRHHVVVTLDAQLRQVIAIQAMKQRWSALL